MARIFIFLAGFWKIVKKTRMHPLAEMDLVSGKAEIDAMESTWVKPQPQNILERVSQPIRIMFSKWLTIETRYGLSSHKTRRDCCTDRESPEICTILTSGGTR